MRPVGSLVSTKRSIIFIDILRVVIFKVVITSILNTKPSNQYQKQLNQHCDTHGLKRDIITVH